jgi:hypothetical protein
MVRVTAFFLLVLSVLAFWLSTSFGGPEVLSVGAGESTLRLEAPMVLVSRANYRYGTVASGEERNLDWAMRPAIRAGAAVDELSEFTGGDAPRVRYLGENAALKVERKLRVRPKAGFLPSLDSPYVLYVGSLASGERVSLREFEYKEAQALPRDRLGVYLPLFRKAAAGRLLVSLTLRAQRELDAGRVADRASFVKTCQEAFLGRTKAVEFLELHPDPNHCVIEAGVSADGLAVLTLYGEDLGVTTIAEVVRR